MRARASEAFLDSRASDGQGREREETARGSVQADARGLGGRRGLCRLVDNWRLLFRSFTPEVGGVGALELPQFYVILCTL